MTGTLDENDVRACDDCHLHGTALRIREAVAEIARLQAELKAMQAAPLAQLALYAAWLYPPVPSFGGTGDSMASATRKDAERDAASVPAANATIESPVTPTERA